MEEIALKDLDSRLQKQIENARKAVDKNPTYAADILRNIVGRNPGCLEARKILHQAQQRTKKGKTKGFGKLVSRVTSVPFSLTSESKIKKDPVAAMESAEEMLASDPYNPVGFKVLGAAAEAAELYETAAFAYEELREIEPDDVENLKALMKAYIQTGRRDEAVKVGDAAYRDHPTDDEIQSLIRRASVEQSIDHGHWEEEESFREKLKDEEEAQKLEQASRAKTGESGVRSLIEEAKKSVEEEPDNINHYRDLVSNYRRLGEYDNALEWLEKARELETGKTDVNLERLSGTIRQEKMAESIKEKEEALEADPENESLKKELEQLREEERRFRLEQTEHLVKRYPNEFSYRYELGELYFGQGETDKAIKELQLAQRSPKVRVNALILLGKAYQTKGFHDMAAEQFSEAKSEITGMNDQKKEVLYQLGTAYEQQGDMEKAMAEFKDLYGADIGYRDVAEKIDAFYSKKNS